MGLGKRGRFWRCHNGQIQKGRGRTFEREKKAQLPAAGGQMRMCSVRQGQGAFVG